MEFNEAVNTIVSKIEQLKDGIETEEATKNAFVMPFIGQVLGYDVFNPNEVIPEFTADVGIKKGEKVDYALVLDGEVQILIECKKIGAPLILENASQLYRYFGVTHARIGVLTNGQVWNFYADIEEPNKMDSKPFLVLDLLDVDPSILPELKKMTKQSFDLESVLSSAEELKYVGALRRAVGMEFQEPSDDFVRLLSSKVYDGRFTQQILSEFKGLVTKALKRFLSDQVNDRLKTALGADSAGVHAPASGGGEDTGDTLESSEDDVKITTTEEEIAGWRIIKAIVCNQVAPERVTMRDAKSYCAIFLDDNNHRPVARLYFNTKQRYLGVVKQGHKFERVPIDSLNDIYTHSDELHQAVSSILED